MIQQNKPKSSLNDETIQYEYIHQSIFTEKWMNKQIINSEKMAKPLNTLSQFSYTPGKLEKKQITPQGGKHLCLQGVSL